MFETDVDLKLYKHMNKLTLCWNVMTNQQSHVECNLKHNDSPPQYAYSVHDTLDYWPVLTLYT